MPGHLFKVVYACPRADEGIEVVSIRVRAANRDIAVREGVVRIAEAVPDMRLRAGNVSVELVTAALDRFA